MTWTHGVSAYRSMRYACRCDICCAANTTYTKRQRDKRAERLRADSSLAPHGSVHTYVNWLCRCRECTTANAARSARLRVKT
jgi:adenylyl- and sulfurtransferase ThiI